MKKVRILFWIIFLLAGALTLRAQEVGNWTGVVVDANGEPVIGAAVMIKGKTTSGSITDIDGKYAIQASANDDLIFSCLGYQTETFKAGSASARRVVLKDDTVALESAVVTALGIKRDEKSIGYSATKVESESFANVGTTGNWLNGISGQVAGLNIDRSSGPNGSMRVTVRGESSADLENNTALFVVDGVPMYNTATSSDGGGEGSSYAIDYGNGTADIDPENIENVTVLKGAAATALYGSAASNGAIIITTKSAENQDAVFKVNFKTSFAADVLLSSPDLQYEYGQGSHPSSSSAVDYYYYLDAADRTTLPAGLDPDKRDATSTLNSWGPKMDGALYYQYYNLAKGINVHYNEFGEPVRDATPFISYGDWFKNYFKTGLTFNNSIALSGKINKDNSVRVTFTNNTATGIVPNSPSSTNSLSLKTTSQLGKWLRVETSVNYRNIRQDNIPVSSGYGSTAIMYSLWCYAPNVNMDWVSDYWLRDANGTITGQNSYLSGSKNNAYFVANECINNQLKDRVYGNVSFKADIVKGLDLTIRGGLDLSNDFRTQRQGTFTQTKPTGWYREQNITSKQYSGDFLLKYNTRFAGDFEFTGNFGGSILYREYGRYNRTATALMIPHVYTLANAAYEPKTLNYAYKRQTNSLYGMLSFSWKNAVFLDVTGRNDWSSTLPANNRSFFYPSVSGSIALNDLFEFGRENGLLNLLKIRASWAQVGNDTAPYRIEESLQYTGFPGTVSLPTVKSNTDLRPEIVSSWEVGLELRMFKNRLSLDAAYYDSVTKDLISQMPISYANGVNYMYVNAGSIRNRGVEASLTGIVIKTRDFQWKLGANFTLNRNTVVSLGEGIDSWIIAQYSSHAYMTAYAGQSMTMMYGKGFKRAPQGSTAIDANGNVVDVSGLLLLDGENFAQVDTDLQKLGDVAPDWKGGFNTTFKYKGVSLYIGFDGQVGGHCWSYTNWIMNSRGKGKATLEGREGGFVAPGVRETPDGNYIVNTTAFSKTEIAKWYQTYYTQTNAEVNFVSTQFLKLREVRLEWQLPKKWLTKTKVLSGITISAYGNNLYCWSDFPAWDPEGITMRGSAVVPGFEVVQMPSTAQFGASIGLTF